MPVRGLLLLGHRNNAPWGLPDSHPSPDATSDTATDGSAHGYAHPGPNRDPPPERERCYKCYPAAKRERNPGRGRDFHPDANADGVTDWDPAAQPKRHA